jgi:sterol 3beta-glucosyltransferase
MLCNSPKWMVSLAIEALRHANARGVLLGGWANLSGENVPDHLRGYCEENVLFVASAPHEWLFPQCSCIVHHGGSGTTAASVRSGRPTIITPIMGDQFDFAAGVDAIGCGVGLKQLGGIDGIRLGDAIRRCLEEESIIAAAKETGENLRAEDGCEKFCTVFDEWLVDGFASGEWLKKHRALMDKCEESWQGNQKSRCTVS